MSGLPDRVVDHLRQICDTPDLSGTRYRLLGELGRGGMGTVYAAEDTVLERRVALKVLNEPDLDGEAAARLLREARVVARLEHPGIVPVYDAGALADGRVYYAMKLVEGRRLDEVRASAASVADLLRVFERLCEAVAFAHAHGVVHRDLKPENVMVGPFGEVLVMDWRVAKVLGAEEAPGTVAGTPEYMAPEQSHAYTYNRFFYNKIDEEAKVCVCYVGLVPVYLSVGPYAHNLPEAHPTVHRAQWRARSWAQLPALPLPHPRRGTSRRRDVPAGAPDQLLDARPGDGP